MNDIFISREAGKKVGKLAKARQENPETTARWLLQCAVQCGRRARPEAPYKRFRIDIDNDTLENDPAALLEGYCRQMPAKIRATDGQCSMPPYYGEHLGNNPRGEQL